MKEIILCLKMLNVKELYEAIEGYEKNKYINSKKQKWFLDRRRGGLKGFIYFLKSDLDAWPA